jgi:hypothetical protein
MKGIAALRDVATMLLASCALGHEVDKQPFSQGLNSDSIILAPAVGPNVGRSPRLGRGPRGGGSCVRGPGP